MGQSDQTWIGKWIDAVADGSATRNRASYFPRLPTASSSNHEWPNRRQGWAAQGKRSGGLLVSGSSSAYARCNMWGKRGPECRRLRARSLS